MADDVDDALLRRLQALRASADAPARPPAPSIGLDAIAREDALATRLERLRLRHSSAPSAPSSLPARKQHAAPFRTPPPDSRRDHDNADAIFRTEDDTLEEFLAADLDHPPPGHQWAPPTPTDDQVGALLEELAAAIPNDDQMATAETEDMARGGSSDDSDGDQMASETSRVIDRAQDEIQLETALGSDQAACTPQPQHERQGAGDANQGEKSDRKANSDPQESSDLDLPSLPCDLPSLPSATTATPPAAARDDIAARMDALRASSSPSPAFPSVPTSRPSAASSGPSTAVPSRLATRTAYTDDVDSWCTVCLVDAALRCLGCDDDPYCARCWWEMHLGPSAGFDERSHRAVQFSTKGHGEKQKTALGAS